MFATSLRLRLFLAFAALVSLILFVGVVAYGINEQVRSDVAELRASNSTDLRDVALDQVGLEIEGYWNPTTPPHGAFVATKVTQEPAPRRPQLRGAIQAVSSKDGSFTMYGQSIQLAGDVESAEDKVRIEQLQPGMRVDVNCKVDAGGKWYATKIQLKDVKASDKVKGSPLAGQWEIDGVAPDTIDIHGLQILLEPVAEGSPENAMAHIAQATQMLQALQDCGFAAHELVNASRRDAPVDDAATKRAATALERAHSRFERTLQDATPTPDTDLAPEFRQGIDELVRKKRILRKLVFDLLQLRTINLADARKHLDEELEPYLDTMIRYVGAYLEKGGEELRDDLRDVQGHTETTTRVALITCAVAIALAIVLGVLMWRAIHRPIRALHDAAVALGQGRLDTRVEIRSKDELGVLAGAFNRMVTELAASTVSVASLEAMFESMAAGVILCDQHGRVTNANRAAQELVDRSRQDLIGRSFDTICRVDAGAASPVGSDAQRSAERTFVRSDGSELPVSLSVAELRSAGGTLQGHVFVAQDLTPIKHIEAQLRESLGEKEMLLREVHHRVKNNMQVISSLLAMQSTGGDPVVRARLEESQNRIRTIALIHEQLYQSTEVANIDTRSYLNVLSTHLLQSFGMADRVHLVQDVANVDLDIDQCLACGLIVNELLTNAMKYAFPDGRQGTIRLSLRTEPDGMRVLEVADDGCGMAPPDPQKPKRKTLGTSLVAKLARQLRGRVETDGSRGTVVRIVMPPTVPANPVTP